MSVCIGRIFSLKCRLTNFLVFLTPRISNQLCLVVIKQWYTLDIIDNLDLEKDIIELFYLHLALLYNVINLCQITY